MPRFKLTLEYAGTRYSGWQIQTNARTIQGELNRAVSAAFGVKRPETYGAGRTDAGVHALGQVAHLDLPSVVPPATLLRRLNEQLPADINILDVERVPARFHARHSAVARSYVYQFAERRTAFAKPFVWWVQDALDLDRMQEAARAFVGFADFRAFTDDDPAEKSTTVKIERVRLVRDGRLILLQVVGSHFLWKMVRRLAGVLAEVGRGGLDPAAVPDLLTRDSDLPPRLTAPASGLFLERVFYEPVPADLPITPAVVRLA
ncbi:MAG: tRNA pseudouridine(38-40) synthase TruA [Acidobacteriota bacterium]|jgi:tRNA pseudouridine38-40 synthase|nr:MAG: tRNA pseudouridine(38-40) synthase TruA [Acidobacteriota bacterium]